MIKTGHVVTLCFTCFASLAHAQLDSLKQQINYADDKTKASIYLAISTQYNGKNSDSLHYYASKALEIGKRLNDEKVTARALTNLGTAMLYYRRYDSAQFFYDQGLAISRHLKDTSGISKNLTNIGIIQYYRGNFEAALRYYIDAATFAHKTGDFQILASLYDNMGMIYQQTEDVSNARKAYLKAYQAALESGVVNSSPTNLATLYIKLKKYDSALYYLRPAVKWYREKGVGIKEAHALGITGFALMQQQHHMMALDYFDSARVIFNRLKAPEQMAEQYLYSAITLRNVERYREAFTMLDSALKNSSSPLIVKDIEENKYLLFEKLGRFDKSLASYKNYIIIRDSLNNLERQKKIDELETKYETQQKNREIETLSNQSRLQELTIRQQYWFISGGIAFFIICILLIVLFYRQQSLKKKNTMLELEQRFLRTQMNPHFIFNALSAIQKFIVKPDHNPIEGASFISMFGALMRQFLNHSRHSYILLEEEIKTLTNYLSVQQIRFENTFEYSITMADDIDPEAIMIPPLLAQPFIENALEHGLVKRDGNGRITVSYEKKDDNLILKIQDNGTGLSNGKKKDHESMAIKITEDRLQLLSGKSGQSRLTIRNIHDYNGKTIGVEVFLLVPVVLKS